MQFGEIKIYAPDNRINDYLIYCEKIFNTKKIELIFSLENITSNDVILIDDSYLNKIKNKNSKFLVLCANGFLDFNNYYKKFKSNKNIYFFLTSNFFETKNCISLNKLNYYSKNKLAFNNLKNLSFFKKFKFCFSFAYGIYNLFKYFKIGRSFLISKKVLFCGKYKVDLNFLKYAKKKYNLNNFSIILLKKILLERDNLKEKLDYFNKSIKSRKFKKLSNEEKMLICQYVFRFIFFSHFKKFKNFKILEKKNIDVLRSGIYKKHYHLNTNPLNGNSFLYIRSILLKKFYKNQIIDLCFFSNDKKYDKNQKILKEIKRNFILLHKLLEFNDTNIDAYVIKNLLKKNINYYLK